MDKEQERKEWRDNWLKGYNEVGDDPEAQREYAINDFHNTLKELVPQAKENGLTASQCTSRLQFLVVTSTIGECNRLMANGYNVSVSDRKDAEIMMDRLLPLLNEEINKVYGEEQENG